MNNEKLTNEKALTSRGLRQGGGECLFLRRD